MTVVDARDGRSLAWPDDFVNRVLCGDARAVLQKIPDASIDCILTSPPYWGLRAYPGTEQQWNGSTEWYGQLGLEPTWTLYIEHLVSIFREAKRVLTPQGSLWLNLGDTFLGSWGNYGRRTGEQRKRTVQAIARNSSKSWDASLRPPQNAADLRAKHKLGLPWRVRFALNEDGWISRGDVVWHKPNALPSPVKDRLSTRYELLFHFVKSRRYFFDLDAIREPHRFDTPKARSDLFRMLSGRKVYKGKWAGEPGVARAFVGGHPLGKNPGDVWKIATRPFKGAHFATFPEALCVRPILATCPESVCLACGQPRMPVRKLPASYQALLSKGGWTESDERSVSPPVGEIVGYRSCQCEKGFRSGVVLDPFCGSGTTIRVARALSRDFIGVDLFPDYCRMAAAMRFACRSRARTVNVHEGK